MPKAIPPIDPITEAGISQGSIVFPFQTGLVSDITAKLIDMDATTKVEKPSIGTFKNRIMSTTADTGRPTAKYEVRFAKNAGNSWGKNISKNITRHASKYSQIKYVVSLFINRTVR